MIDKFIYGSGIVFWAVIIVIVVIHYYLQFSAWLFVRNQKKNWKKYYDKQFGKNR